MKFSLLQYIKYSWKSPGTSGNMNHLKVVGLGWASRNGYGSKLSHQGTTGFNHCFHLPGCHVGVTPSLTDQMRMKLFGKKTGIPYETSQPYLACSEMPSWAQAEPMGAEPAAFSGNENWNDSFKPSHWWFPSRESPGSFPHSLASKVQTEFHPMRECPFNPTAGLLQGNPKLVPSNSFPTYRTGKLMVEFQPTRLCF